MAKTITDGVHYYDRESDAKEGFAVRPRPGKAGIFILCHGMGERGAGLKPNLVNVVDGFDYDGDGPLPRQYPIETAEAEAFAAAYNAHLVTVNYPTEFNPNDFDYVIDTCIADFPVDEQKIGIIGFSLGGGAVLRYVTSSVERAKRLSFAVAAAPVNWATTHKNVVDAGLQMICTTCENDPVVSPSNVKDFVSKVNALNPKLPAKLIIYKGNAHSGFSEVINNRWIYEYFAKTNRDNRVPFEIPTELVDTIPVGTLNAVPVYALNGNLLTLDGSKSTGQNYGFWGFTAAPDGVNIWGLNLGGNIKAQIVLPKQGTYKLRLTVSNAAKQTDAEEITVVYGSAPTPPRVLVEATGSIVLKYSDESIGTASVKVVDGRLVVTE